MRDRTRVILYTDGSSLGNPGRSGIAFIFYTPEHKLIKRVGKFVGYTTNNVAEYLALIYGMQEALKIGAKSLICYSDSELLVRQLKGEYKVRSKNLLLFYNQVKHLKSLFETVTFCHIPRDDNIEADKLAKKAAGDERMSDRGELVP